MRIFEVSTFSLKRIVPYTQTLPYVLDFLEKHEYAHGRTLFRFEQVLDKPVPQEREPVYRVKQDFPGMREYPIQHFNRGEEGVLSYTIMSNMPLIENGEFAFPDVSPASLIDLCRIAENIPKSYRFFEALMIVDNIHWLSCPNPRPAYSGLTEQYGDYSFYHPSVNGESAFYFSNCLMTMHAYKVGNNPLSAVIEVTPETDGPPLDTSLVLQNLKQSFGEPNEQGLVCVFPYEERKRLNGIFGLFKPFFNRKRHEMLTLSLPSGYPFGTRMYKSTRLSPLKKFSVSGSSPFFKTVLEAEGFRYRPSNVFGCQYAKRLPHNHCISLRVSGARGDLFVSLTCSGYNYSVFHMLMHVYCNNQADMELFLQDTCVILRKWEAEIAPELYRLFGETPSWFRHSSIMSPNCYVENKPV